MHRALRVLGADPGECARDDDGRRVAREVIRSNLAVFLTPVTFGGYSSVLKGAVDRLIPLGSPFFARVGGRRTTAGATRATPCWWALARSRCRTWTVARWRRPGAGPAMPAPRWIWRSHPWPPESRCRESR